MEGIDARMDGDRINLLLVNDADNPSAPATLLRTSITY
ncbi:hypothetical protein SAMCCGM7_pA0310 (plasmid) [Sinorhizobium americanum CCGM7]|nr:hypothetical protein SAMCCGM7_pA0310 [Sinorhizobium americanum CCGM7]